jgi:hypothetical protein
MSVTQCIRCALIMSLVFKHPCPETPADMPAAAAAAAQVRVSCPPAFHPMLQVAPHVSCRSITMQRPAELPCFFWSGCWAPSGINILGAWRVVLVRQCLRLPAVGFAQLNRVWSASTIPLPQVNHQKNGQRLCSPAVVRCQVCAQLYRHAIIIIINCTDMPCVFFVGYKGGTIYWLAIHSNQADLIVGGLRHRRHQQTRHVDVDGLRASEGLSALPVTHALHCSRHNTCRLLELIGASCSASSRSCYCLGNLLIK